MFWGAIIAAAQTAANNIMAYQQARGQADYNEKMVDIHNAEVMRVYNKNQEILSEDRVEARKASMGVQGEINKSYRGAMRNFQAAYTENWGQSANLFMSQIAQRQGEDVEQVAQNLEDELETSRERGEEMRMQLAGQIKPEPFDESRQVLQAIALGTAAKIGQSALSIAAEHKSNQVLDLADQRREQDRLVAQKKHDDLVTLLRNGPGAVAGPPYSSGWRGTPWR